MSANDVLLGALLILVIAVAGLLLVTAGMRHLLGANWPERTGHRRRPDSGRERALAEIAELDPETGEFLAHLERPSTAEATAALRLRRWLTGVPLPRPRPRKRLP